MFGLEMLNVLIGLVTVYLVFGMACTAIVEAVAAWFSMRSSNLEAALKEFFAGDLTQDESFIDAFYSHPLVQALSKGRGGRPSYIPAEVVGRVVEALLAANSAATSFAAAVKSLPGTPETNRVKGLLEALVTVADGDAAALRKGVETHFNTAMDRASGWFKRRTQTVALVASALLVIGANVDTVELATSLASSPAARIKIVEIADQRLKEVKSAEDQLRAGKAKGGITLDQAKKESQAARAAFDRAASEIKSAGLPLGWQDHPKNLGELLAKVAGLFVSVFAVSLGAPFWFDVLQSFMQVRSSGAPPQQTRDEKK